jgi:predicted nucleotidyltransferase
MYTYSGVLTIASTISQSTNIYVSIMRCALQSVLQRRIGNCRISVFGSSAGGIANPSSDIDMSLHFPKIKDAEAANTIRLVHYSTLQCIYVHVHV